MIHHTMSLVQLATVLAISGPPIPHMGDMAVRRTLGEPGLQSSLDAIAYWLEDYRATHGAWPTPNSEWFELCGASYDFGGLKGALTGEVSGHVRAFDPWDHPIVLRHLDPKSTKLRPDDLFSVGPNGIDEGGDGDDFLYQRGFRFGVGATHRFPLGLVILGAIWAVVAILVGLAMRRKWTRMGLAIAMLATVPTYLTAKWMDEGAWGPEITRFSYAVSRVVPLLTLLVLGCVVWFVVIQVRLWRKASRSWECPSCGYDFHGSSPDRCPECGQRVNDAAGRISEPPTR